MKAPYIELDYHYLYIALSEIIDPVFMSTCATSIF